MTLLTALRQCIEAMKLVDFKDCAESAELWQKLNSAQADAERVLRDGEKHGCQGGACNHDSDCAVHNAPALPVGPCDCSISAAAVSGDNRIIKAHAVLQQFKSDWMKVPYFGDRVNKATREAISMAIAPIVNLDAVGCPLDVSAIAQAPKAALTPKEIHRIADECGMYQQHDNAKPSSDVVESFAAAIEAATAPNPKLVEALQKLILAADNIEVPEGGLTGWDNLQVASEEASAALADAGVTVRGE